MSTHVHVHAPAQQGNGAAPAAHAPLDLDHEEVVVRRGTRCGRMMAVAIHSTTLGPALGGLRMWHYPDAEEALGDVLRLSKAMTMKAAVAGLDLGGGKAVIDAPAGPPPEGELRAAILADFAELLESLEGRYITAEDVGTGAEDMVMLREHSPHVVGLPAEHGGSGDPSPFTAHGVAASMRACLADLHGTASLEGRTVSIVGFGHVGSELGRRLAAGGAHLLVTDIDEGKREAAERLGARWVAPEEAMLAECDVLAPCALGEAIHPGNVDRLRCSIVCGSANNVLSTEEMGERLEARGIVYAPDFIANAGGLISVYGELHDHDASRSRELVAGIEDAMARTLEVARSEGTTPLQAAYTLAYRRLREAA